MPAYVSEATEGISEDLPVFSNIRVPEGPPRTRKRRKESELPGRLLVGESLVLGENFSQGNQGCWIENLGQPFRIASSAARN